MKSIQVRKVGSTPCTNTTQNIPRSNKAPRKLPTKSSVQKINCRTPTCSHDRERVVEFSTQPQTLSQMHTTNQQIFIPWESQIFQPQSHSHCQKQIGREPLEVTLPAEVLNREFHFLSHQEEESLALAVFPKP